jgi:hypothetical protein
MIVLPRGKSEVGNRKLSEGPKPATSEAGGPNSPSDLRLPSLSARAGAW